MQEDLPSRVFESVSADYFHISGKTFLVYVDRLSGWPYVSSCNGSASAAQLISLLRPIFSDTGVPVVLKTDGGPQFASSTLRHFLARWGVEHRVTSPYNPKANGHAEATVKIIKKLILTTTANGKLDEDEFARGLLELRNTPRPDGRSPAQILFGHPLRSRIPAHHRSFAKEWQRTADECDIQAKYLRQQAKERYDATARPLCKLNLGMYVDLQDPKTKRWDKPGVAVGIGTRRDYLVKTGSGRIYWRNRRFLRPHHPFLPGDIISPPISVLGGEASGYGDRRSPATSPKPDTRLSVALPVRRSGRQTRAPERLEIRWDSKSYTK
ncbi:uncharacterized protein [Palaemon carinicauda]|uniref:uncharacterized protein n=1 Tax=Palaemon carinicauda TaxID=392227 RepID=UPI0035B63AFA